MSDMLSYEAVQLKKLLAEEKDIRNRYISAAEEISDPQLKEKLQKCAHRNAPQYTAVTSVL